MAEAVETRGRRILRTLRDAVTHNLPLKLLALTISVGLWAFVNFGERDTEEAIKVPVELRQIPAALMITSARVDSVDVRVVGPRTLLGRIDHNQLSLPLDLSGALAGPAVFTVNVDRFNLPRGVRVVRVTPAQITITLERIGRKVVPVELRLEGEPPEDFEISSATVVPAAVEIAGPESLVDPIETVGTDILLLDAASRAAIRRELPIEPLGEYVTPKPSTVAVDVVIEEVVVERVFESVPVGVMATRAGEVQLDPESVRLVLSGPRRLLEPMTPAGLLAVDVGGLDVGAHIARIVVNVPEGVSVSALEPDRVTVTIVAPTPPPDGDSVGAVQVPRPTPLEAR